MTNLQFESNSERRNLHELINFRKYSENVAVVFYDDEKEEEIFLSYENLQNFSKNLSGILIELTNGQSCNIGIFCNQCEFLPVLILGILQANCCFVYLPTRESSEYLCNWSSACEIRFILSFKQNWKTKFPNHNLAKSIENDVEIIFESYKNIFLNEISFAYVMRTSGTTGQFKTVKVPHDAIVPNILHFRNLFEVNASDVIFLSSPLTFDPSIVEIFVALSSGAKLLIVRENIKTNAKLLSRVLFEKFKITIFQTTPSLILSFGDDIIGEKVLSESSSLKILALGGEMFPVENIDRNWNSKNKTKIFDVYGITEVSCWATCQEVTRKMLKKNEIFLGEPLMDTEIDVRWSDFGAVSELFVGGRKRKCILNSETFESAPEFRATGDLVERTVDGRYRFVGRADSQVKRFGKKINLEEINSVLLRCPSVHNSICFMNDQFLFVALTGKFLEEKEFLKNVQNFVDAHLPSHSKPDRYCVLDEFPLTEHGKVDKKTLQRNILLTFNNSKTTKTFSEQNVFEGILNLIEEVLGENVSTSIGVGSFLWNYGCDSVKSLYLVSKLEQFCERKLPNAFEIIVFKTVGDLCNYVKNICFDSNLVPFGSSVDADESRKRSLNDTEKIMKRPKIQTQKNFDVFQKCSVLFSDDEMKLNGRNLKVSWSWNSGKCIDGSPLIVDDGSKCSVYIGSHSHNFASINAVNGEVEWICRLGDRVEGSPAITKCATYVIVGSYDHCVYFIERENGKVFWRFETGDIVKSTAIVSKKDNLAFVGGHDGCLHALNFASKIVKWKRNVSSRIASTPCLDDGEESIFTATLNGWVHCISTLSGETKWAKNFIKPIFSQLILFQYVLLFGSVDGCIYFVDVSNGVVKRKFESSGPIFNSPIVFPGSNQNDFSSFFIFGNFNGYLFRCDSQAELTWKVSLNDAVTTSPYLFPVRIGDETKIFCCLCTKNGNVFVLDADDGKIISEFVLPGEIFSSPVVWRNNIYVGCRNDYLFCLTFF